jgi:hypothetical protein
VLAEHARRSGADRQDRRLRDFSERELILRTLKAQVAQRHGFRTLAAKRRVASSNVCVRIGYASASSRPIPTLCEP